MTLTRVPCPRKGWHLGHSWWSRPGWQFCDGLTAEDKAEAILRRRVQECVTNGLHSFDGHCGACGVSAK